MRALIQTILGTYLLISMAAVSAKTPELLKCSGSIGEKSVELLVYQLSDETADQVIGNSLRAVNESIKTLEDKDVAYMARMLSAATAVLNISRLDEKDVSVLKGSTFIITGNDYGQLDSTDKSNFYAKGILAITRDGGLTLEGFTDQQIDFIQIATLEPNKYELLLANTNELLDSKKGLKLSCRDALARENGEEQVEEKK